MTAPTTTAIREPLSESELCPDELLSGQEAAFARDIERLQAERDKFVEVACPACGATTADHAFQKYTFNYVACRACETVYMTPRPSPVVMAAYYADSENYKYWARHIFPASEAARREKLHRPWLERIRGYCDRYAIPRRRMVEVGAGFGTFSSLAKESGWFHEVVAIEPTPQMAAACRERGIRVINKGIEEIDAEVGGADVVVAFEVIEHVFAPTVFLKQCRRLLESGGLLVLSCPNGQGFDIRMLGPVSLAVDPEHVNLFNPQSLRRVVESEGFKVVEVSTPGRLDVEFVHRAIQEGKFDRPIDPFLRRVLVDEYDRLGGPFQGFLADHGLSSHMWLAARNT